MNTEQAKALKVGEFAMRVTESSTSFTKGDNYEILSRHEGGFNLRDGLGHTHGAGISWLCANFDLPPAETNTQWILFDKERMSEAEGYRLVRNLRAITEVVLISDTLAWRDDAGEFDCGRVTLELVEMLVPVVVKYPCLMMVTDSDGGSSLQEITGTDGLSYLGRCGTIYSSLTRAPTTAELAEIGLKQIS